MTKKDKKQQSKDQVPNKSTQIAAAAPEVQTTQPVVGENKNNKHKKK